MVWHGHIVKGREASQGCVSGPSENPFMLLAATPLHYMSLVSVLQRKPQLQLFLSFCALSTSVPLRFWRGCQDSFTLLLQKRLSDVGLF